MDLIETIGLTTGNSIENLPVVPNIYDEVNRKLNTNRTIIINEGIDDCIVENYMPFIIQWNREDRWIPVEKRKPIKIIQWIII